MLLDVAFGVAVVVSAVGTIRADMPGRERVRLVLKPLTTLLILCIALVDADPPTPLYQAAFVAALAASLVGDVLLMLPARYFAAGLASFLVAHVLYAVGMASTGAPQAHWATWLPFGAYAVAFYLRLRPHVGALRPAVLIYALVITGMAWVAFDLATRGSADGRWLALAGALLFVASDSVLAFNRFVRPVRHEPLLVLGTYYSAQLLLALSV